METADHAETASYGNRKEARAFRAQEKALIEQGRYEEAQQLGVDDVRARFGSKYDDAIEQMPRYNGPSEQSSGGQE